MKPGSDSTFTQSGKSSQQSRPRFKLWPPGNFLTGFTMAELVVAASVIAVLTILIMNFVATQLVDNAVKNGRADLQLQIQQTLDIISRDIKLSANVDDQNR